MQNHPHIFGILLSFLLSLIIGLEREHQHKQAGVRTVILITLGATFTVLMTLKWQQYIGNDNFDMMRAIAYYIVGIGFVGGGIIRQERGKLIGLTTASLLLPLSIIGFFCGMKEYLLAFECATIIYFVLKLKYITIKFKTTIKRRKNGRKKVRSY